VGSFIFPLSRISAAQSKFKGVKLMFRLGVNARRGLMVSVMLAAIIFSGCLADARTEPTESWSGWSLIDGSLRSRPWLTADEDALILAGEGANSRPGYKLMNYSGSRSSWEQIGSSGDYRSPALISFKGKLYAFARRNNGQLYFSTKKDSGAWFGKKDSGAWSGWTNLGLTSPAAPAATEYLNKLYLAARGNNNQVYVSQFSGKPGSWRSIGGKTDSDPFIGVYNDELIVAIKGVNGEVLMNRSVHGYFWRGWEEVPGNGRIVNGPAFVEYRDKQYLIAGGTDNNIWYTVNDHDNWSGWTRLGQATAATPGAAVFQDRLYVVARDYGNRLYQNVLGAKSEHSVPDPLPPSQPQPEPPLANNWTEWRKFAEGETPAGPAAAIYQNNLFTMVRGMDNGIYAKTNPASGWAAIGGATPAGPGMAMYNNVLYALVRGTDNRVYLNRFTGRAWSGWTNIGGATESGGALFAYDGSLYAAVRGTDNGVYLNATRSGGVWSGWKSIGGATPSKPGAAVLGNKLFLVARGTDDRVYLKTCYQNSWSNWAEIPGNGKTLSGPAPVVFNDRLWVIVRGTDNRLYYNIQLNQNGWSGWKGTPGGGLTDNDPCAFTYEGGLRILVKGIDNRIYLISNGGSPISGNPSQPGPTPQPAPALKWDGWVKYEDGQAAAGPAVTVFNNRLYTLARGADNGIYLKEGFGRGWSNLGGATPSKPALAGYNGKLYALVRGTDNGIYLNKYSGNAWNGWAKLEGATISGGALMAYEGFLYAVVRGTDNGIFVNKMDSSENWSGWVNIGGAAKAAPALALHHNRLYLAVRGTDDRIYLRSSKGVSWDKRTEIPGNVQTNAEPGLESFGGELVVTVKGMDNRIYFNKLAGEKWSGWAELPGGGATPEGPAEVVFQNALYVLVRGTDNNIYYNRYH